MQYEISEGINPYAEWVTLSRGDSWKRSVGVGQKNIHQATKAANTATSNGLVWVGGVNRGGSNQQPITILSDVANAGLNILSNRPAETTANLPSTAPLIQHFRGPSEVSGWVVEVLGEVQVTVCDGCTNGAKSGKGLIPKIEAEAEAVLTQLTSLVSGTVQPTLDNLEAASAPAIIVTLQLIKAIQNQEPTERSIMLSKLAQEIAEARIMEQAMIIRRLMLSGVKEGNVSAIQMAVEEVDRALAELDGEINNVIFEKNVRNKFVADTAVQILLKDNAMRTSSLNTPRLRLRDERSIEKGTVSP
jgi:integrating conjugative element protein (TIGR03755 family)